VHARTYPLCALMRRRPPRPPLFPYTTLFRSISRQSSYRAASTAVRGAIGMAGPTGLVGSGRARRSILPLGVSGKEARITMAEGRSEEHTSELQSRENLVCRLLLEKKKESRLA